MYELFMGQLRKVETFESPNQPSGQAVIKNTVATVKGYEVDTTLFFETMPEKNEPTGKIGELHFINGALEWVYLDGPLIVDDQIIFLKTENETLNLNNIAIWEALIPLIP